MKRVFKCLQGIVLLLARRWLWLIMTALGIYITLPWAAPMLAKAGWRAGADMLYTLYSPFCHQFAFRSPFLFGEQAFYPRAAAGTGYQPFEAYALNSPAFLEQHRYWQRAFHGASASPPTAKSLRDFTLVQQFAARHFIGDETVGYKTSLCARDLAIYTMLFIGGIIYWRYRWRIRPLPFLFYLLFGLSPIAIDGFSQLLSYPPFELWPPRETQPLFRLITGGLFGLMSAWLAFPHIERSMQDIIQRIERGHENEADD